MCARPERKNNIMRSDEVIRAVIEKHGAKMVASALGLSIPHIYKWAEPPAPAGSGSVNPLDRVEALIKSTGDEGIAEWVCLCAQGFFVKNIAPQDVSRPALLHATAKLVKQYTDMLSLISTVIVDTQVSKQEACELRKQWQTIQSLTEAYVRGCEKGTFHSAPTPNAPITKTTAT
jgi:hypothetical protein